MYKNQLQELAQRSCFNLPSYACTREGPDHAPRFKATVNFNGEMFDSPYFYSTLRQAEHSAAEVALNTLAKRGPSRTLAAKALDETGVYKNLLQETAHRAGLNLPVYTTLRSGPGHIPVFSCTVELAGMSFTGEPAKTKKQAQKNAANCAWHSLKQMSQCGSSSSTNSVCHEEQDQIVVARFLASLNPSDSINCQNNLQKGDLCSSTSSTTSKGLFASAPCAAVHSHFQSWGSTHLSPDMAVHHIWLQEQAVAEHQRRLMSLAIPIPQVPPPRQVVPWMHSLLQPSHHPHILITEQPISVAQGVSIYTTSSPLYLSTPIVPDPSKTRTTATIQEIPVDKSDEIAKLSTTKTERNSTDSEPVTDTRLKEDTSSPCKTSASVSIEAREGSLKHASIRCTGSQVQPGEAKMQNAAGVQPSRPTARLNQAPNSNYHGNIRMELPSASQGAPMGSRPRKFRPAMTAPPRMQQHGVRSYPARPIVGRMQAGGIRTPFMAPAVQIRSVVPVCASPPPRRMTSPSQMRPPFEDARNATTGEESNLSSGLGDLHI